MKILIFSWRGPKHPHAGGAEIVTHEHAKAWIKAGHQVSLFTSFFPGAKSWEVIDGVNIIRKGSQIISVQFWAFIWYLFQNKENFDLVIDQFHGIPFFSPLFVKTKKLAFIHEVTKDVWQYNPLSQPLHTLVGKIGAFCEPFIFKLFYLKVPFMTVSDSTKKELTEIGIFKKNITVIHNGINGPSKIPQFKKDKNIVTFIGALARDKGIEDALMVFSLLSKKNSDFKFWVIGKHDDEYFVYLKALTAKLGLTKKVKFWGFVRESKKFDLLGKSYLVINPSVREGWGLTVMEAGLMGVPTVAYNVAGLKDAIINGKTGLLTKINRPEMLSEKVLELFKNNKKYQTLSKGVKSWADKFNWEIATKKSRLLIEKIARPLV